MIKPVTSILAAALLSLSATISATVTLPSVLSDGVVLQREQPIKIWGKALPGEQVTVKLKSSKAKTVADDSGKWSVTLSPLKAGGPYVLTVMIFPSMTCSSATYIYARARAIWNLW